MIARGAILVWNGGPFLASIADRVEIGMNLATAAVADDARSLVGVAGGGEPSAPGEPPRMQRGTLQANIGASVERDAYAVRGFIGVRDNVAYALRLELGFVGVDSIGRHYNQAPRPFLRPALLRNFDRVVAIIADQVRG